MFWNVFQRFLGSFWRPKWIKKLFFWTYLHDEIVFLGTVLGGAGSAFGVLWSLRVPQGCAGGAPVDFWVFWDVFQRFLIRGHSGINPGSFRGHSRINPGSFWDHFGIIPETFWNYFGISLASSEHILESFWDDFRIILLSSWDHCVNILRWRRGDSGITLGNHFWNSRYLKKLQEPARKMHCI